MEENQLFAMSAKKGPHEVGIHSSFKSHPRKSFSKPGGSQKLRLRFACNNPEHLAAIYSKHIKLYVVYARLKTIQQVHVNVNKKVLVKA